MQEKDHPGVTVRRVEDEQSLASAMAVRWRVFVEEQQVPPDEETDSSDPGATHVIARLGDAVVATGRLISWQGEHRIGRIAVLPEWRRRGIGSIVIAALEAEAARQGVSKVGLHAQTYVQALYAKLGYVVSGPPFVEAGIDHVPMTKTLGAAEARNGDPRWASN